MATKSRLEDVRRAMEDMEASGLPITCASVASRAGVCVSCAQKWLHELGWEPKCIRTRELVRLELQELESRGVPATCRDVGRIVGISTSRAGKLIRELGCIPTAKRNLDRVRHAMADMESGGGRATCTAVGLAAGISASQAAILMRRLGWVPRRRKARDLVRRAVAEMEACGAAPTAAAVARKIGVNYKTAWTHLVAIRGRSRSWHRGECVSAPRTRKESRPEDVRRAMADLESRGRPITCKAVGEAVGISPTSALALMYKFGWKPQHARNRDRVQKAIESFREKGERATVQAVAGECGIGREAACRHMIEIRGRWKPGSEPEPVAPYGQEEIEARIAAMRGLKERLRRRPTPAELDRALGARTKGGRHG